MTGVTAIFIFAVAGYSEWQRIRIESLREPLSAVIGGIAYVKIQLKSNFDVITDFITFGGTAFETLAVASIFGFPYAVLLPVFARDILHVGAAGLGGLLAATGAGALVGGLLAGDCVGHHGRRQLLRPHRRQRQ